MKAATNDIIKTKWCAGSQEIPQQEQTLCFSVGYPGLLVGLGYAHQIKSIQELEKNKPKEQNSRDHGRGNTPTVEGQIANGFSLDFVTGLPYIPGSEVKGTLRSAFLQNRAYVQEVFCSTTNLQLTEEQIAELEQVCFGTRHPCDFSGALNHDLCAGDDVFLDAWPVQAPKGGRLLGLENITPHRVDKPELDGLVNPTPITLLKIMPETVFQFRFILKETILSDGTIISPEQKLEFYKALLLDLGTGAKTNVGFGVLNMVPNVSMAKYLVKDDAGGSNSSSQQTTKNQEKSGVSREQKKQHQGNATASKSQHTRKNSDELLPGQIFDGKITKILEKSADVELSDGRSGMVHISEIAYQFIKDIKYYLRVGKKVKVKILSSHSDREGKLNLSIKQIYGQIFDGKVTRILKDRAFVDLSDGRSGMVHISEISRQRVFNVDDYLREGQEVRVKILGIDINDILILSIKQA